MVGYVDIDALIINPTEKGWVGQISYKHQAWGTFIIAGGNSEDYVAQTIMHELGHYLLGGESADHQDGTFMSAVVGSNEVVTPEQKAWMQKMAREEWGY